MRKIPYAINAINAVIPPRERNYGVNRVNGVHQTLNQRPKTYLELLETVEVKEEVSEQSDIEPDRISRAMGLLNLTGTRIISGTQIGIWSDLDGLEIRAALRVVGMGHLPVTHLETANIPVRYKLRHCPERKPSEPFASWLARAKRNQPELTNPYRSALPGGAAA